MRGLVYGLTFAVLFFWLPATLLGLVLMGEIP
jgi:hypothetical protein